MLNEIGKSLSPKVRCVINIANRGAGLPDGGLFTADQFQKGNDAQPKQGQPPARGVLEAKPASEDVEIARTIQVERYCGEYGLVLVTNFRQFLLLGRGPQGKPVLLETYSLADDEKAFWTAAVHAQRTASEHGQRFCEYLKRVMLSNAPLTFAPSRPPKTASPSGLPRSKPTISSGPGRSISAPYRRATA